MSKLKEFFNDVGLFNRKYKCAPLIIFALIYVASPIDFFPEFFYESWVFYLDDMTVLIFSFVITYLEVFYNERNRNDNENVEGIYSAVRRGGRELGDRGNIGCDSSLSSDAVLNAIVNQIPPTELPTAIATNVETDIGQNEPGLCEPTSEQSTDSERDANFYEQHFIDSASTSDDCIRQISELSRPDAIFIEDGNAIIW